MLRTASWFLIITTGVCFGQQPTAREMPQEMVWVSRQGDILERVGAVQNSIFFPELSPDEKRIAVSSRNGEVNDRDVWIHEIATGQKRRITKVRGNDNFPLWTPDGRSIVFTSSRVPRYDLFRIRIDPLEAPMRILEAEGTSEYPRDMAPNGEFVIYTKREDDGRTLWKLDLESGAVSSFIPKQPGVWADGGKFSPDGTYFAYSSNEAGCGRCSFVRQRTRPKSGRCHANSPAAGPAEGDSLAGAGTARSSSTSWARTRSFPSPSRRRAVSATATPRSFLRFRARAATSRTKPPGCTSTTSLRTGSVLSSCGV